MPKKTRKGNKRLTSSKGENAIKSQSFEYSGSEADSSKPATQSMQNPVIESPRAASPRKDQAVVSPKVKSTSPKNKQSVQEAPSPSKKSPKQDVLASPFLSPGGAAATANASMKSPQTVEFVISPITTDAGAVQRLGSKSERVTPDALNVPAKSPKQTSPKTSPKIASPDKSPKKSPKAASPTSESPKAPSPKMASVRSPKTNSVEDPLRESVDLATMTSPKKSQSPKSKQSSPKVGAGPVAISTDGAVTVTIEPEPVESSPKSRGSPKSQKSPVSDSIPMFAGTAYPTSPGGAAIPILELAEGGAKSASRTVSPASAAKSTTISPRVADLQAKLSSPSAAVVTGSPKLPGSGVSSIKSSPNPSQVTSPKLSDFPPLKPATPNVASLGSPKVDLSSAVLTASPKIGTPVAAAIGTSPKSASRVANINSFVEGATPEYPSPPRAQAMDSAVMQEVSDAVNDSTAFHSAITGSSPKQTASSVPMSVLSATAVVSSSVASPDKRSPSPQMFVPVSFDEAMSHIAGTTGRSLRIPDNVAPLMPRKPSAMESLLAVLTCKACLGTPQVRLAQELDQDKDVQTILSNTPFNSQVEIHRKIMQALWAFYFGKANVHSLEMVGDHWGKLGFQSIDPSVEVNRAIPGGVLNLLHILFLIENYPSDAKKWLSVSDQLPFAGVSIAMSCLALEMASKGALNAQYNKDRMVTPVTAHFYVGLMRRVYENPHSQESLEDSKNRIRKNIDVSEFFTSRPNANQRLAGMSS